MFRLETQDLSLHSPRSLEKILSKLRAHTEFQVSEDGSCRHLEVSKKALEFSISTVYLTSDVNNSHSVEILE